MVAKSVNNVTESSMNLVKFKVIISQQPDPNPYSYSVVNQMNSNDSSKTDLSLSIIERYQEAWDRLSD